MLTPVSNYVYDYIISAFSLSLKSFYRFVFVVRHSNIRYTFPFVKVDNAYATHSEMLSSPPSKNKFAVQRLIISDFVAKGIYPVLVTYKTGYFDNAIMSIPISGNRSIGAISIFNSKGA
jgi:hypothetical protein